MCLIEEKGLNEDINGTAGKTREARATKVRPLERFKDERTVRVRVNS